MPKYLVLNKAVLRDAVLAEVTVDQPLDAVLAVPSGVNLPSRVVVVRASAVEDFLVVDDDNPEPPTVVVRATQP